MSLARQLSILILAVNLFGQAANALGQGRRPGDTSTESDRPSNGTIRGRVVMPNGSFSDEAVKITVSSLRGPLATIYTETQGQFEFQELQPGTYYLEFEANRQVYAVVRETVQVYRGTPSVVTVALRPLDSIADKRTTPSTVSVSELSAKIPEKARKEFEKANSAGATGRTDEAIAHLRKAIAIFPLFIRARNDLGTYLLSQGKLDEAEEELRKAMAIDGAAFNPTLNLGIVLVHKHEFVEADETLRKALSLEPNSPAAHLYSGLALLGLEKFDAAESHFKSAYSIGGNKFGLALYHLGQLYVTRGDNPAAIKSFEEYLSVVPDARNAQQVKQLIAMLRR